MPGRRIVDFFRTSIGLHATTLAQRTVAWLRTCTPQQMERVQQHDELEKRIGEAVEAGVSTTLNERLSPAENADLPEQVQKDWGRGWRIAFKSKDGVRTVSFDRATQTAVIKTEGRTPRSETVSLPAGKGQVKQLAQKLNIDPARFYRLASLMVQTEIAPAEDVLSTTKELTAGLGATRVNMSGGERLGAIATLGEDGYDRLELRFDRLNINGLSLVKDGVPDMRDTDDVDGALTYLNLAVTLKVSDSGAQAHSTNLKYQVKLRDGSAAIGSPPRWLMALTKLVGRGA